MTKCWYCYKGTWGKKTCYLVSGSTKKTEKLLGTSMITFAQSLNPGKVGGNGTRDGYVGIRCWKKLHSAWSRRPSALLQAGDTEKKFAPPQAEHEEEKTAPQQTTHKDEKHQQKHRLLNPVPIFPPLPIGPPPKRRIPLVSPDVSKRHVPESHYSVQGSSPPPQEGFHVSNKTKMLDMYDRALQTTLHVPKNKTVLDVYHQALDEALRREQYWIKECTLQKTNVLTLQKQLQITQAQLVSTVHMTNYGQGSLVARQIRISTSSIVFKKNQ